MGNKSVLTVLALWLVQWIMAHTLSVLLVPIAGCIILAWALGWITRNLPQLGVLLRWLWVWGFTAQCAVLLVWSRLSLPWWGLLLLAGAVFLVFPLSRKRAPIYPTPKNILENLKSTPIGELDPRLQILDVGAGWGASVEELKKVYPLSVVNAVEVNWFWFLIGRWRTRRLASWIHADALHIDWKGYDIVYVFGRPEMMSPIWDKFKTECKEGTYLVSLAFDIPSVEPSFEIINKNAPIPIGAKEGIKTFIYRLTEVPVAETFSEVKQTICASI